MARNAQIDAAISAALGEYTLTADDLAHPTGVYRDLEQIVGTPGWDDLGFSIADLQAYCAEISLERSVAE